MRRGLGLAGISCRGIAAGYDPAAEAGVGWIGCADRAGTCTASDGLCLVVLSYGTGSDMQLCIIRVPDHTYTYCWLKAGRRMLGIRNRGNVRLTLVCTWWAYCASGAQLHVLEGNLVTPRVVVVRGKD